MSTKCCRHSFWVVLCCIAAGYSPSAAFTTLAHGRFIIKYLLYHSSVYPSSNNDNVRYQYRKELLKHLHKPISVHSYSRKLWGMKEDNEISNVTLQNSTTLTNIVSNNTMKLSENDFDWDTFLDTPFFDPNVILNDPNSNALLKRFASWVREDYETVEVIVTATLFIFLIVVTQELLRVQIYGIENYVPFTKGISPGSLF